MCLVLAFDLSGGGVVTKPVLANNDLESLGGEEAFGDLLEELCNTALHCGDAASEC